MKEHARAAAVVIAAAVVAYGLYGVAFDVTRGGGLAWQPVVEGLVTGAAALAVWMLVRTRGAAAAGLGVALALVILGAAEVLEPAAAFTQAPMAWAVVLALTARLAVTEPEPASGS